MRTQQRLPFRCFLWNDSPLELATRWIEPRVTDAEVSSTRTSVDDGDARTDAADDDNAAVKGPLGVQDKSP